jgi:hypothetical protein
MHVGRPVARRNLKQITTANVTPGDHPMIDAAFAAARQATDNPPVHRFDQGSKINQQIQAGKLNLAMNSGLCGGVSTCYLGLKKAGKSIFAEESANPDATWNYINRGHRDIKSSKNEECEYEIIGEAFGLKVHARSIVFDCPVKGTGIPKWVQENSGYFLIATPNHYCAAVNDKFGFTFFDPNAGDVLFPPPAGAKLSTFIVTYLARPDLSMFYKLVNGQKAYLTWYK